VAFRRFNDANTPPLRNSLVNSLFEDHAGRLWTGSDTGEITWRDSAGFHPVVVPPKWHNSPVDRFAEDAGGDLWAVNRDGVMLRFRDCECQGLSQDFTNWQYSDLTVDGHGQVWAVRFGGALFRLQGDSAMPDGPPPILDQYRDVARARQGGIWVRDGPRLRRWDHGQWVEDRGTHSWTTKRGVVLDEDRQGDVWVGTAEEGVFVVNADASEHVINLSNGLGAFRVSQITSDEEQNVWIGTDGGGLQLLRRRALFMIGLPSQWQGRALLSVSPASDGGLWVGTEGAGVLKLKEGHFSSFKSPALPAAGEVRCVLESRGGRVWAGTQGFGLLTNNDAGDFVSVAVPQLPERLRLFYTLYEDKEGAVWMGTQFGLARYFDGQWSRLGTNLQRAEVRSIGQTPDGAIWAGMRGGGIARYQNGQFTQFQHPQGLGYEYIWCLLGDADGSVWIGTPGAGLLRWKDGAFSGFTTRDGLPSDFICNIQDDGAGHFWIGSYAGIFRVDKSQLQPMNGPPLDCLLLDASDGLTSLEIAGGNQPSACRTADGRLWFATSGGLAMVDPSQIRLNRLPPPVQLVEVLVDGKPALNKTLGAANPSTHESIVAPPGFGSVEFRYTALSYSPPQRCRFRYRLDGLDSDWIDAGTRRSAFYSRLPPRQYSFQVIACNGNGVWNNAGAVISFTVLPYLWERWWFEPLVALAGLCLVTAVVLAAVRQRHRRRMEVLDRARAVDRERLRIARDLHDDLGGGLTEISLTSALAQDQSLPSNEVREYVREITARSAEMVNALDEIVWAVNPKNDDLNSLVTYFCQYAGRFLQSASLSCRIEIPPQLPARPLSAERRHNLFLAFKEALHNVVKHSAASSFRLSVALESRTLRMELADNGRGFSEPAEGAKGDGLRNMRERLQQIGGGCEIASVPGQGTSLVFTLPL
jgi:signal transduction histidine kinase/ligand-binding sensor domain-containing protein